jgi:hypothetical protein
MFPNKISLLILADAENTTTTTNIKPNENHMSFEEIFSYAGLNCAFCVHPDLQHKDKKGDVKIVSYSAKNIEDTGQTL